MCVSEVETTYGTSCTRMKSFHKSKMKRYWKCIRASPDPSRFPDPNHILRMYIHSPGWPRADRSKKIKKPKVKIFRWAPCQEGPAVRSRSAVSVSERSIVKAKVVSRSCGSNIIICLCLKWCRCRRYRCSVVVVVVVFIDVDVFPDSNGAATVSTSNPISAGLSITKSTRDTGEVAEESPQRYCSMLVCPGVLPASCAPYSD